MSNFWKCFLMLLLVILLAGCGNFKDSVATSSLDTRESDRFKNMLMLEREQLPENSYSNLGEVRTEFSRPEHVTNYNLIKKDARRSLKVKAVRMGGNALVGFECKKQENKGWQDELSVQCRGDVLRIESRKVLKELQGEPFNVRGFKQAQATDRTGNKTSYAVGWLSRYGVIVTNYHTVKDSDNISISLPEGEKMQAEVVKQDPGHDIAILSVQRELPERNGLPLAQSTASEGSEAFVLGFSASSNLNKDPRIVKAAVNSTSGYRGDPRTYRITSSLERGYSGSPLLNPDGMVLGMVVQKGDAQEFFPGQKELGPDEHYAVKIGNLNSMLDEYTKTSAGKNKGMQISVLRDNIFTVIAK